MSPHPFFSTKVATFIEAGIFLWKSSPPVSELPLQWEGQTKQWQGCSALGFPGVGPSFRWSPTSGWRWWTGWRAGQTWCQVIRTSFLSMVGWDWCKLIIWHFSFSMRESLELTSQESFPPINISIKISSKLSHIYLHGAAPRYSKQRCVQASIFFAFSFWAFNTI